MPDTAERTSRDEIHELIRSRYPIVVVQSHEEDRIIEELARIGRLRDTPLYTWSCTQGLKTVSTSQVNDDVTLAPEILAVVGDVSSDATVPGNAMFVLLDFHPYLEDPSVVRGLRDLAAGLPNMDERRHVILLSPFFPVPVELQKDVAIVDFELPTKEQLDEVVGEILEQRADRRDLCVFEDKDARARVVESGLGLTLSEYRNSCARSLARAGDLDVDIINSEKRQIIRRNGILEFHDPRETFDDIGGLNNMLQWLMKRQNAFGEDAREFSLTPPRGILIVGPPGTGKSLTAKAVGAAWRRPTLRLDMGRVYAGLVGASEANMRSVLKTAEAVAPCVLWLN